MIFDGTNVPGSRAEKNGIDQPELWFLSVKKERPFGIMARTVEYI